MTRLMLLFVALIRSFLFSFSESADSVTSHDIMFTDLDQSRELFCCSVTAMSWLFAIPLTSSTLGFPVRHYLPEFDQIHVHRVSDAIEPSHPQPPSPLAVSLSQHQGLLQWVGSSHQVAKALQLQLQHQSFQWIIGFDFF